MNELVIELEGVRLDDGSVHVTSRDLPLFTIIGRDEKDALSLVLKVLPEYLKANVPEFVELRQAKRIGEVLESHRHTLLPPMIAILKRENCNEGKDRAA